MIDFNRQEFLVDIRNFCNNYNTFDISSIDGPFIINKKTPKFVVLISDIMEKLSENELNHNLDLNKNKKSIRYMISNLTNYIISGDNLLDSYFQEKTYENFEIFQKDLAKFALIPWQVQKYGKNLPGNLNKKVIKMILNFQEVAKLELDLRKNPSGFSLEKLLKFTELRNNNFFLFHSVLAPFIKEEINQKIVDFLKKYVIIDSILDDIVDVISDFNSNNFNILLFLLKKEEPLLEIPNSSFLINVLIEKKIFDFVYNLAFEYADSAFSIIEEYSSDLFDYFRFIINGSIEGIKVFKKYNYFEKFSDKEKKYEDFLALVLKPHPWSVFSFTEIFNDSMQ
ncbi:MAG: hypothetical protein GY870_16130 [archaeon]|nr:hypothetical protein [archaeon]